MEGSWFARKDELMGKAVIKSEEKLVDAQVEMWSEHAAAAREIRIQAFDYIKENGFKTAAEALQAIKWAQEEERRTRGVEAFYETVKEKSNDELLAMIRNLADRQLTDEEIIEVQEDNKEESA